MRITPERGGVTIVLLGHFNPKIFNPDWLFRNKLIEEEEYNTSSVEVIHNEISKFSTAEFDIQVDQEKAQFGTASAPFINLCDLVVNTFVEFLSHTPVHRVAINRVVHFPVETESLRSKIGERLAPKEPWGEWAPFLSGQGQEQGGLRTLVMEQSGHFEDREKGWVRAKIEPSNRVDVGIFMEINDDFRVENPGEVQGSKKIMGTLQENFDKSIERSHWVIDQVMGLAYE